MCEYCRKEDSNYTLNYCEKDLACENGFVVNIYLNDSVVMNLTYNGIEEFAEIEIELNYCPMCGRKLGGLNDK